jgi:hypothetical protein
MAGHRHGADQTGRGQAAARRLRPSRRGAGPVQGRGAACRRPAAACRRGDRGVFQRRPHARARYTKSFNTLTSAFQAQTASRQGDDKIVQWLRGDDAEAKQVVAGLIRDAGFVPVDLGGTADCTVMEAPRRPGAVYGEEYRAADAPAVVEAVRAGRPIPPTPQY